jgi:hypothetical protein
VVPGLLMLADNAAWTFEKRLTWQLHDFSNPSTTRPLICASDTVQNKRKYATRRSKCKSPKDQAQCLTTQREHH